MNDLTLISKHHQRYQNGTPVMGDQFCTRAIRIENKDFDTLFRGTNVIPSQGYVVSMFNMDTPTPMPQMQPKLMEMVTDNGSQIVLKGVALRVNGNITADYRNYGITLHLLNRHVVKCVLHMFDRETDIEYDRIQQ